MLPLRKEPEYRAVLPGKLFEYLASGRPILGIGQSDGAMARILCQTKTGKTFEWDDSVGIRGFLEDGWKAFLDGGPENEAADIEKYSRRSLAARMASLLESVIKISGRKDGHL